MKNLENYGVQRLNSESQINLNGGETGEGSVGTGVAGAVAAILKAPSKKPKKLME